MGNDAITTVAVVGMSCRFPDAPDLDAFWHAALWGGRISNINDPNHSTAGSGVCNVSSCIQQAMSCVQEMRTDTLLLTAGLKESICAQLIHEAQLVCETDYASVRLETAAIPVSVSITQVVEEAVQSLKRNRYGLVFLSVAESDGDGIVLLTLKRLEDAINQGDHIYATVAVKNNADPENLNAVPVVFNASPRGLLASILSVYHATLLPEQCLPETAEKLRRSGIECFVNSRTRPWIVPGYEGMHKLNRVAALIDTSTISGRKVSNPNSVKSILISQCDNAAPCRLLTPRDSEIFMMRAASQDRLQKLVHDWINYINDHPTVRLADLSYSMSQEVIARRNEFQEASLANEVRLAIVALSAHELCRKLSYAEVALKNKTLHSMHALPPGVFYSSVNQNDKPQLAFMLPGLGSAYPDMLLDLCLHYPHVREVFDYVDGLAMAEGEKTLPSMILFPNTGVDVGNNMAGTALLATMDSAVVTVLLAEWAMYSLLSKFGIKPDALIGCSTGEFAALTMGGVADIAGAARMFYRLSVSVARSISRDRLLDLASMKVNAGIDTIEQVLGLPGGRLRSDLPGGHSRSDFHADSRSDFHDDPRSDSHDDPRSDSHDDPRSDSPSLYVTAEFTYRHSIVTGSRQAVVQAAELLKKTGIEYHHLPIAIPYHTPLVEGAVSAQHDEVAQLPLSPPAIPIWSCASAATYGTDVESMRCTTTELFAKTILFERTVKAAHASGINTFIEVGPRDNLASFANETFNRNTGDRDVDNRDMSNAGNEATVLCCDIMGRNSLTQLNHLLAELFCRGCDVNFNVLFENRQVEHIRAEVTVETHKTFESAPSYKREIEQLSDDAPATSERVIISYLEGLGTFHKQLMEVEANVLHEYLASK